MEAQHGAEGSAIPLHRRTMVFEAFDQGDSIEVVGRLSDVRPWSDGSNSVATVHDMELRVRVRTEDYVIVDASAHMDTFPHIECPTIEDAFSGLVGLSVSRGYTKEVQARFGGPRGCTHLEQIARSLGPVVIQAVTSRRALAVAEGRASDIMSGGAGGSPWARNSCHIWAEDGPAEQKLAHGWRPGTGPYPAPALVTFVERQKAGGDV